MKSGKLLTLTALATGITLGTFIDSAEARRLRSGGSSNISQFNFTVADSIVGDTSSSGRYDYQGAVSDISFSYNSGFINNPDLDAFPFSFNANGRANIEDVSLESNILSFVVGDIDIPANTVVAPTTLTEQDFIDDANLTDIATLNGNLATFTEDADIEINFKYEVSDTDELDIASLSSILNFIDGKEPIVREDGDGDVIRSSSSYVDYDRFNNDFENFLTDVVGYRSDVVNADRLISPLDDFELVSNPSTVPEASNTIGLVGLGTIAMLLLNKRTLKKD